MADTIVTLGDFVVQIPSDQVSGEESVDWTLRWNSGVRAEVVNPFTVEQVVTLPDSKETRLTSA